MQKLHYVLAIAIAADENRLGYDMVLVEDA